MNDDADSEKRRRQNRGAYDAPAGPRAPSEWDRNLGKRTRGDGGHESERENAGDPDARNMTNPFDVWGEGLAQTQGAASERDHAAVKQAGVGGEQDRRHSSRGMTRKRARPDVWTQGIASAPDSTASQFTQRGGNAGGGGSSIAPVQRKATGGAAMDPSSVGDAAAQGTQGASAPLPYLAEIQRSFGKHDVSNVRAQVGGHAARAAAALGARAYTHGNAVAFAQAPDLHTAAHEAAHVVQQRAGIAPAGLDGGACDSLEHRADAVADAVVAGRSAEELLGPVSGPSISASAASAVQRKTGDASAAGAGDPGITPPKPGIDKPAFIDHSDGANIRSGPAEAGGKTVHDGPLPPATRVFVSGTHPSAPDWWYVTAFLEHTIVRGYVQKFRVATDLPEPLAKLHQVVSGDTAEKLAVQEYKTAVRDGHDLRYYENVLLYVNRQAGRAGIRGSFQDPGLFGGGANNVQLEAGHRIWLVSPAYAKELESIVPDGSFSNGLYAKAKRFVQHVRDIVASVTESKDHFGEVAGEYAQAIRDHMAEIVGITAGFIMAEATSMFLAATPTGVGQAAAAVIQLALSAFGAANAVQAGVEALKHGSAWLTTAWTAKGDKTKIAAASVEFIKMLVSIAMAALSAVGAKGNYANALKIGGTMNMAPAMALANGGTRAGAGAATAIGPTLSPVGAAGAMMTTHDGEGGGSKPGGDAKTDEGKGTKRPSENAKADPHEAGAQETKSGESADEASKSSATGESASKAAASESGAKSTASTTRNVGNHHAGIEKVRPPSSRHTLTKVTQGTLPRDVNTVVEPRVDVNADVAAINEGKAVAEVSPSGVRTYRVNGRVYGVEPNGTLYPMTGDGLIVLNRNEFKILGIFNKFGDTARAMEIINLQAPTAKFTKAEVDAARQAWKAGQAGVAP